MGAQVISAAIYFKMKMEGVPVYADLSYFDQTPNIAKEGVVGEISHWEWQLGIFGLQFKDFEINESLKRKNVEYIADGESKMELGLEALFIPKIRNYFTVSCKPIDCIEDWGDADFLCIHIRRGDYVNVASHLINEDVFLDCAKKFTKIIHNVAILSDSLINDQFKSSISEFFPNVKILCDLNADTSHLIMRRAKVLICSNSQFSLIAAALNDEALALVPSQWYGEGDRSLEAPIMSRCKFYAFNNLTK